MKMVIFMINLLIFIGIFMTSVFIFAFVYYLSASQPVMDISPEIFGLNVFFVSFADGEGGYRMGAGVGPMGILLAAVLAVLRTVFLHRQINAEDKK